MVVVNAGRDHEKVPWCITPFVSILSSFALASTSFDAERESRSLQRGPRSGQSPTAPTPHLRAALQLEARLMKAERKTGRRAGI